MSIGVTMNAEPPRLLQSISIEITLYFQPSKFYQVLMYCHPLQILAM
jgi:hypothetical protein